MRPARARRRLPLRRILSRLCNSVLIDPGENVWRPLALLVAEKPRRLQPRRHRSRELLRPRVHDCQRLAGADPGADRRLDNAAGRVVDAIVLFFAAGPPLATRPPAL